MNQNAIVLTFVAIGLVIGLLATYRRIKSLQTRDERKLAVRSVIIVLLSALLLIFLPLSLYSSGLIPRWLYWTTLGLFFVFLVLINIWSNQQLAKLRKNKS